MMFPASAKYMAGLREEYNNGVENTSLRTNGVPSEQNPPKRKNLDSIAEYLNSLLPPSALSEDKYFRAADAHRADPRPSAGSTYSTLRQDLSTRESLLGIKRPKPHKIWKKKYIKLIIVGDSGLGKTTLIKALMSTPGERMQVHDGSYTPGEQFRKDPESLCSVVTWRDEDDRTIWVYKIQDTPGYGDNLNSMKSISLMQSYIEKQNEKWLELEQSKDRKEDLNEVEDPRVDLCLFCIPPHRLRPADLLYMAEISQYVPIVPVVTKGDTMTIREASLYRQEVANKIANPMLPGIKDKINVFKFERDSLERAGISDSSVALPPFLVVASNDINEELAATEPPIYWPERRYPWGTAEAFNSGHSDLMSLRALLLKESLEEIGKHKRSRYEDWRGKKLGGLKLGQRIRSTLLWTLVPAFLFFKLGRSNLSPKEMLKIARGHWDALPFRNKGEGKQSAKVAVPAAGGKRLK